MVAKATWVCDGDVDTDKELMAPTSMMIPHPICPFVEEDMITLWDAALQTNHRYWKIRKAVMDGERRLLKEWSLPIMISECSVDAAHRLRWRCRVERSLLWEITGNLAAASNDLRVGNQLLFSKTKIIIKQTIFNRAHTKDPRPTSSIQR